MMQVWLVLMAIFFDLFSRGMKNHQTQEVFRMLALGAVVISIVLVFVNGGTTG